MEWRQDGNRLVIKNRYETLWLEPWGTDALRVRATQNPRMSGAAGAPNPQPTGTADIRPLDDGVEIRSGRGRSTFPPERGNSCPTAPSIRAGRPFLWRHRWTGSLYFAKKADQTPRPVEKNRARIYFLRFGKIYDTIGEMNAWEAPL